MRDIPQAKGLNLSRVSTGDSYSIANPRLAFSQSCFPCCGCCSLESRTKSQQLWRLDNGYLGLARCFMLSYSPSLSLCSFFATSICQPRRKIDQSICTKPMLKEVCDFKCVAFETLIFQQVRRMILETTDFVFPSHIIYSKQNKARACGRRGIYRTEPDG